MKTEFNRIYNLVANGPEKLIPNLKKYDDKKSIWIGIDGGNKILHDSNIIPQIAFGDFDSVTTKQLQLMRSNISQIYQFPPEKDETDFQITLNYLLDKKPKLIRIFGWSGGRIDQYLSIIDSLANTKYNVLVPKMELIDKQNYVQIFLPGTHKIKRNKTMKYVAFIPLIKTTNLTIKDFKYTTDKWSFERMISLSSNEFIKSTGTFAFDSGLILVAQSKD